MDLRRLAEVFSKDDIQWRISEGGVWFQGEKVTGAKVLAYLSNRAIMQRLDEVCGPENWQNTYQSWHAFKGEEERMIYSQLCGISIRTHDGWVTKWDGAECTDISGCKGGLSDAMKRAAVQWGIGRYLYEAGMFKANISDRGMFYYSAWNKDLRKKVPFKWDPPTLPDDMLPPSQRRNKPKADPPVTVEEIPASIEYDEPWKNTIIHFGKAKGMKLGAMTPTQIQWFQETWLPNKEKNGHDPQDEPLMNAILQSMEGMIAAAGPREEIPF